MAFQTNDVGLVNFPFSDLSTTKARPAVVVSSDVYHQNEPDVVFAALTSNLAAATNTYGLYFARLARGRLESTDRFQAVIGNAFADLCCVSDWPIEAT